MADDAAVAAAVTAAVLPGMGNNSRGSRPGATEGEQEEEEGGLVDPIAAAARAVAVAQQQAQHALYYPRTRTAAR